jgi:phenylacetate-coenzyme A ligase PaaK-like adenylate-forming protein
VATDSPFWNPKTETLDRERIESLQLAKLRRHCEWAAARSPWYRRRFASEGFVPGQLSSLADLRRSPLLTRDDWMASQEAKPPYGEIPVIDGSGAIRIHTTSGTTEIGTIMVFECAQQPGGTHIIEDHMLEEVLDPDTLEPVPYGERASLGLMHNVVTGLALEYEHLTDLGA